MGAGERGEGGGIVEYLWDSSLQVQCLWEITSANPVTTSKRVRVMRESVGNNKKQRIKNEEAREEREGGSYMMKRKTPEWNVEGQTN